MAPRSWNREQLAKNASTYTLHNHFITGFLVISLLCVVIRLLSHRKRTSVSTNMPTEEKNSSSTVTIKEEPKDSKQSQGLNAQLEAIRQEILKDDMKPVFPWIAPPTPLPGPYDAPYYPLPSIRLHSEDNESSSTEDISTKLYHRQVPLKDTAECTTEVCGTTTISNQGWRRTQWTVSAG